MINCTEWLSLEGRRALVTGACGNLGTGVCDTLASMGADLVITDVESRSLDALKRRLADEHGVDVVAVACDLEQEDQRESVVREAGRAPLSIVVHNAAFVGTSALQGWSATFEEQSLQTWRRAIEVNLTAPFHLTQALVPELRKSHNGTVIHVGSIYGLVGPVWSLYEGTNMASPAAYAASKGGLMQLTRWLATTLAPDIRVNAIAPGGIERGQPQAFVERYCNRTPMGRMARANDVLGTVAYLASDMSTYVTGQTIAVDGGWTAW